jgi:4-hydroxybenzoate polyprenyltransferase
MPNAVGSFLKLVRYPNLLFIALTQLGLHYLVILPILRDAQVISTLNDLDIALLVLSTVLIAAGGYIINDYFDVQIDRVNKPDRVYIDRSIKRRWAIVLHQVFSGVAVAIGVYLAWKVGNIKLAFIQPIVVGFLWFYSTGYKKQPLTGNIVVSFLTGLVVLIVGIYQRDLFYNPEAAYAAYAVFIRLFFYFVFAFLVSLMREIVKDMEDLEGDERFGCRTLPVMIGINKTKWVVYALAAVTFALVMYIEASRYAAKDYLTIIYLLQTLQVPIGVVVWQLYVADSPKHFHRVSTLIKLLMLMGIFSMAYLYFLYTY